MREREWCRGRFGSPRPLTETRSYATEYRDRTGYVRKLLPGPAIQPPHTGISPLEGVDQSRPASSRRWPLSGVRVSGPDRLPRRTARRSRFTPRRGNQSRRRPWHISRPVGPGVMPGPGCMRLHTSGSIPQSKRARSLHGQWGEPAHHPTSTRR